MHQFKRHRTFWGGTITLGFVLLLLTLFFLLREDQQPAPVAISKGSRLLEDTASWETAVDQARARELALADEGVESILSGVDFGFLVALPLTSTESQSRFDSGCADSDADGACARVSFYDYSGGGTVDAIVNLDTGQVVESTVHRDARPGASSTGCASSAGYCRGRPASDRSAGRRTKGRARHGAHVRLADGRRLSRRLVCGPHICRP